MYNEGELIERVIEGVVNQSVKPYLWLIINDNSNDNCADIVRRYESEHAWIKLIDSNIQMAENYGPKIVSVRTVGYNYVIDNNIEFDYLAHLDADIVLCKSYFEDILKAFENDKKLGICAGNLKLENGKVEQTRSIYIRDANRVFRKECLEQTGYQKYMWLHDSSDKMQALFYGWNVYRIDNISLHLRPTGDKMKLKYCFAFGCDTNRFGYSPIPFLFKSMKFFKKKPYIIAWLGYSFGYISGTLKPKYFSKEFNHFLNDFYLKDIRKQLTEEKK